MGTQNNPPTVDQVTAEAGAGLEGQMDTHNNRDKASGSAPDMAPGSASGTASAAALDQAVGTELDAAVLRRLLTHFDERKDVQNIELMILAGFCRNCLSKWYLEAARERGIDIDLDAARERVYGMPYAEWKSHYQAEATPEQIAKFKETQGE